MDELKLLSELRADAPEPSADRLRALRARALRRRRRTRFWLAPSLLTAVAAGAAVFVQVNGAEVTGVRPAVVETTAVRAEVALNQAASTAEKREPGATPRPDQWLYRKIAVRQPGETAGVVQEYWTRYDGTRQGLRQDQGTLELMTIVPEPDDDDLTPREFAAKLAELPTDPGKLLAHVKKDRHWMDKPAQEKGGAEPPDARAFRVLSVYLDQEVALPPKLEAAVYRALARIPGVRVYTGVHDAAGRPGLGISYEPGAGVGTVRDKDGQVVSRTYLILDPTTYRYLGRRVDYLRDEVIGGQVISQAGTFYASAELAAGIADEPGRLPSAARP